MCGFVFSNTETGRLLSRSGESSRVRKAFLFGARSRLYGLRTWLDGAFPCWDSWKALEVPGGAPLFCHQTQEAQGLKHSAVVGCGGRGCLAGRVPSSKLITATTSSKKPPLSPPEPRPISTLVTWSSALSLLISEKGQ